MSVSRAVVSPVALAAALVAGASPGMVLVALAALVSCSGAAQPDPPDMRDATGEELCPNDLPNRDACSGAAPSYREDVGAIIEQRCATCHHAGNTQSRDVFADYEAVYAVRQTVLTRVYGCVMPPEGAAPLAPEERRDLLQWLVCGAPDN